MSQAAIIGVVALMMMSSSMGAVALMMGGDDEKKTGPSSPGPSTPPPPPSPSRKCKRTVTATRTDAPGSAWGMPLEFKCGNETINVGSGPGGQPKTVGPYSLAAGACPASIDKNNWLGGYTYPDTFDIKLSECLDEKTCKRNVTAIRKDAPNSGWGMPLEFKCGEQTVTIGNSSTNSKTTAQPVNISQVACPATIDKSNWLGGYTYPDVFKIDVSDCI
jgi:hypothetical protein